MPSFISELRRRNVLRAAAAYALVAWIIIEAGSVLLPTFGAPGWAFRIYVITVLGGFVVSIVFAWIFEITPEGVKLDRHVDRTIPADPQAKQKMNFAIIALLAIALGVSITFNITGIRNTHQQQEDSIEASIAVLPLTSVSTNPENELFTDGIHDDLLTKLANIAALKVISRTSVMEYRNTSKSVGQIGEELGVRTILAGSVRRSGDMVRINLELIDISENRAIWGDSYDRILTMENIFLIQTEIADQVALALSATLTPSEQMRVASIPTEHLEAYSLVTEGRDNLYRRQLDTTLRAREQFERALVIDPQYAEAHAGLATSILLLWINHSSIAQAEAYEQTQASLDQALAINPELADAYATYGLLKSNQYSKTRRGDQNVEAEQLFDRALQLNPNHASAYMWFASLRRDEGRVDEAIGLYLQSIEVDPLGRIPRSNLPALYAWQGQSERAIEEWLNGARIHPDWPTPYAYLGAHLFGLGRLDEALAWYIQAKDLSNDPFVGGNMGVGIYMAFGKPDKAIALLGPLPPSHPFAMVSEAFKLLIRGDLSGSLSAFVTVIDGGGEPPFYILDVVSSVAILVGDLDAALRFIKMRDPVLTGDTALQITENSWANAIKLAYIYIQRGDIRRANEILLATLAVVTEKMPRLGTAGHGIADVQIYALLGRREDAIEALNQAVAEGFRSEVPYNLWNLEYDPYLDSIRTDVRFEELQARVNRDLDLMHDRVNAAELSGDWQELRDLTRVN